MKTTKLIAVLLGIGILSQLSLSAKDDTQLWSKFGTSFKIDDESKVKTSAEFRFYEDMGTFDTWELYAGYERKATWGKWAIGGKRGEKDHRKDSSSWYNSYLLDLTPSWKLDNGWTLSWRSRFEAKDSEGASDLAYRYRGQVGLSKSIKDAGKLTKFSIKNESFHDFHGKGYNANRFYPVVLSFKLSSSVKLDVWGMIHSKKKNDDWGHDYVLGTSLGF